MRPASWLVAVALLALAGYGRAAGDDDLVALINEYRAEPRECEGRRATMVGPLSPSPLLARIDLGRSRDLGAALSAAGYRAALATTILVSGTGDAAQAMRLIDERYCASLLDARYSQIGVERTRDGWRINLARPLLPPDLGDWRQAGRTILRLVNDARARPRACGPRQFPAVAPLTWNEHLADAALAHSRDMAQKNYFSHVDSSGASVAERALRSGYRWRHVGENIAAGLGAPEQVVLGWLASPGHCANIMAPDFAEMGAAYATNPGSAADIYWTQTFGRI